MYNRLNDCTFNLLYSFYKYQKKFLIEIFVIIFMHEKHNDPNTKGFSGLFA